MRNLTPHAIAVSVDGTVEVIQPSGTVARVSTTEQSAGLCPVTYAPVIRRSFGEVENIGSPSDGPCLVSSLVLSALGSEWRGVAFAPDTGDTAIRNEKGQIIAVTRLVTV